MNSYWDLRISYHPGSEQPSQDWQLFKPSERKDVRMLQGTGDQQKIADDACSIVTEQGAKLN